MAEPQHDEPSGADPIDRLLARLVDGPASAADITALEGLLQDADGRRRYVHYLDLHAELQQRVALQTQSAAPAMPADGAAPIAGKLPASATSRIVACVGRVVVPVTLMAASVFVCFSLIVSAEEPESKSEAPRKIRTAVTQLAVDSYPVKVQTNAVVRPRNHVTISSEVAGRVVKIHPNFEVGSFFSKGDVLIELDEENVTQQEISHERALANKILAESQVEIAKTSIREYLEGTYKNELAAKKMALVVAQTNLRSAKDIHGHASKMFRKGYATNWELLNRADTVKHAELEIDAARRELDVFENITKGKVLQELRANLQAAQARLTADEAALKLEKQKLQREQLRAPFDGRVLAKQVGLGQQVGAATVLGEVMSVDYAEIRLPLARRDLRYLKLPEMNADQAVQVELRDAVDDSSPNRWTAKIVRTEGMLDPDSLELFAIAVVEDPFGLQSQQPALRMGQPVLATVRGNVLDDVIKLPRAAVSQFNQVILVNREDLTLSRRTIEPLWSDDQYMIVRDPTIRDGDLLATTQLVYAPEGSAVEIIPDPDTDARRPASDANEVAQR